MPSRRLSVARAPRRVDRSFDREIRAVTSFRQRLELGLLVLIGLNVVAIMLESVHAVASSYGRMLEAFETVSIVVFTVEYLVRLVTCTSDARYRRPLVGRLRWMATPMALVDLIAIVPFYLAISTDLRMLRIMRLARVFRVLKIARYSRSIQTLAAVLRSRREEFVVLAGALVILLLLASSLMFVAESAAQPEAFSSIPATMWWGVCTLTTVGYGDVYPITPLGKCLGAVIALLGVGLFALPAGLLAGGFAEQLRRSNATRDRVCPTCGTAIERPSQRVPDQAPDQAPERQGERGDGV